METHQSTLEHDKKNPNLPLISDAKTSYILLKDSSLKQKVLLQTLEKFKKSKEVHLFELIKKYNQIIHSNIKKNKSKNVNQTELDFSNSDYYKETKKDLSKETVKQVWIDYYLGIFNKDPNKFKFAINVRLYYSLVWIITFER